MASAGTAAHSAEGRRASASHARAAAGNLSASNRTAAPSSAPASSARYRAALSVAAHNSANFVRKARSPGPAAFTFAARAASRGRGFNSTATGASATPSFATRAASAGGASAAGRSSRAMTALISSADWENANTSPRKQ
jgi:hypothetical protein